MNNSRYGALGSTGRHFNIYKEVTTGEWEFHFDVLSVLTKEVPEGKSIELFNILGS